MSGFHVRSIRRDELPQLLELYEQLHEEDSPVPAEKQLQAVWDGILGHPGLHVFVGEMDGRVVSTCTLA
ncbi:MAG: GNAT family N-acetyltransferase, partial [Anaerolineales bacterium]